uniref:Methionine adenosyltransferase n=1 Tax=uncultured marine thaumarchaeote KM3_35_A11 TaxID=1456130 RepID=A0A075GYT3_9ARCH|nr:methionine adenosyltransferase (metK) [uncultured marine thaumarchaeote KM3_35_A11]
MPKTYIFTSESVTEGHPDKVCDHISDAILDEFLRQDPDSRVAVETLVTTDFVTVAGEVTSKGKFDIEKVVRDTIAEIGYNNPALKFDAKTCKVIVKIDPQSPNISQGVTASEQKEQGAGDQGLMFGYATNETDELMPLPILLAHKLTKKLADVRKSKELAWVRPDGKSQVSVVYVDDKPQSVKTVVISTQHDPEISNEEIKKQIIDKVIKPVCGKWWHDDIVIHVNPTGKFEIGGPHGDAGLTGRKIIVDSYGGMGRHGGGAFSGKDPSKVDRSACYMCRYVAKNLVAAGLADRCEVQIAYAIGVCQPLSLMVNTFETNKIPEENIEKILNSHFDMKPASIVSHLNLKRPIFKKTAGYGHFGRNEPEFTWEKTDKAEELRKTAGL